MPIEPNKIVSITSAGIEEREISLLDIVDHLLNTGVVIQGSLVVSLAGVDLLYVGLSAVVTSVETALKQAESPPAPPRRRTAGD